MGLAPARLCQEDVKVSTASASSAPAAAAADDEQKMFDELFEDELDLEKGLEGLMEEAGIGVAAADEDDDEEEPEVASAPPSLDYAMLCDVCKRSSKDRVAPCPAHKFCIREGISDYFHRSYFRESA